MGCVDTGAIRKMELPDFVGTAADERFSFGADDLLAAFAVEMSLGEGALAQAGAKTQRETPLPVMEEAVVESFHVPEEPSQIVGVLRLLWTEAVWNPHQRKCEIDGFPGCTEGVLARVVCPCENELFPAVDSETLCAGLSCGDIV